MMLDGADQLDERMADRHDQVGSVIPHVSHILADREPFEDFGRLALVQDHRFGALFGRGWFQPFLGKVGRKHHRPAVVDVDHTAAAVGGDDHETFVLAKFVIHQRELADAGAERGLPVASANEVGLLFRPSFIHPFIPAINGAERPVRPGRAEERTVGDLLGPGVDRRRLVLGPMRPPTPAHTPGQQLFTLGLQHQGPRRWRDVVPGRRFFGSLHRVRPAQQLNDFTEGPELGDAATHGGFLSQG